jgi:heme A synthase
MAESGASTACEGWPLCNGAALPGANEQEVTHMVHRYLAALLSLPLGWVLLHLWKQRELIAWSRWIAFSALALYGSQVMVGAFNVWLTFPDALTISHTAIAAALWFTLSAAASLGLYAPSAAAVPSRPREAAPA